MKIKTAVFAILIVALSGCNSAMVINGKVMGFHSGKFIYQDGYLTTQYKADIEPVWQACLKAVADLKGEDIEKERKISTGVIKAVISDEKVKIRVEYIDRELTSVGVFSGVTGNNMASKIIQDKIAGYLINP
ncbi:MAG: DUF3568 family protein [Smithella sp.]|jgi:hypothetical protein|nr:DUF3568 family protein [Smithella sp.]